MNILDDTNDYIDLPKILKLGKDPIALGRALPKTVWCLWISNGFRFGKIRDLLSLEIGDVEI